MNREKFKPELSKQELSKLAEKINVELLPFFNDDPHKSMFALREIIKIVPSNDLENVEYYLSGITGINKDDNNKTTFIEILLNDIEQNHPDQARSALGNSIDNLPLNYIPMVQDKLIEAIARDESALKLDLNNAAEEMFSENGVVNTDQAIRAVGEIYKYISGSYKNETNLQFLCNDLVGDTKKSQRILLLQKIHKVFPQLDTTQYIKFALTKYDQAQLLKLAQKLNIKEEFQGFDYDFYLRDSSINRFVKKLLSGDNARKNWEKLVKELGLLAQ
jgi:hypothetical protein